MSISQSQTWSQFYIFPSSQDPRNALEAYAERANRYSLNLNERVSKDEKFLLCGGAAVVHSGIVDLRKPVLKTADGRLWKDKYGNRVESLLHYYVILFKCREVEGGHKDTKGQSSKW